MLNEYWSFDLILECIKDSGKNAKMVHALDLLFLHQNCFKCMYIMLNIMSFLKNQPGRTAENNLAVVVLLPT